MMMMRMMKNKVKKQKNDGDYFQKDNDEMVDNHRITTSQVRKGKDITINQYLSKEQHHEKNETNSSAKKADVEENMVEEDDELLANFISVTIGTISELDEEDGSDD